MQRGYAVPLLRAKMLVVAHSFQLSTLMWTTNIVAFRSVPRLHPAGHCVALRKLIHRGKERLRHSTITAGALAAAGEPHIVYLKPTEQTSLRGVLGTFV